MITKIRSIYWFQIIFLGAFYTLALALPISEALKQVSAIVIILLGVHLIFEDELKIKEDLVSYSVAGIILSSIISAVLALNPPEALQGLIDIVRIMLIFLIIKNLPLNIRQVIRFTKILFSSMLLALLYGLYQLYFNSATTELLLNSIGQISQSSFYLVLVLSIALSNFLIPHNQLQKGFLLFIILIILSSLAGLFIIANQTMIFISLLIVLLFFIFALQSGAKNSQLLFLFVMIFVIPVIIFFGNDYRLEKLFLAFSQRDELLQVSILAWLEHNLFFGIGIENLQYINPQNYLKTEYTSISLNHNTYLSYLVERGLFGLGLYLLFIFSVLAALIKKYLKTKDSLVIAAIMIWFATFIISGICTTFQDENGLLIALIWGMALNEHLSKNGQA
jgi:O-antigen ligase